MMLQRKMSNVNLMSDNQGRKQVIQVNSILVEGLGENRMKSLGEKN